MVASSRFTPFLPIEKHAAIGNRRTAALVAADGTVDWLCLPDYDGTIVFGTLLAPEHAGFFRLGPAELAVGSQRYVNHSAVLVTRWSAPDWELELTDFMESPENDRQDRPEARSVVRQLRCLRGRVECRLDVRVCYEFDRAAASTRLDHSVVFDVDAFETTLWCNHSLAVEGARAAGPFSFGKVTGAVPCSSSAAPSNSGAWGASTWR